MRITVNRVIHILRRWSVLWQRRKLRERRVLLVSSLLLLVVIGWLGVVEPALLARQTLLQQVPELRAQLARLQSLAREVADLPTVAPAAGLLSQQVLEQSLTAAGLKAQQIRVSEQEVTLNFSDVSFASLAAWLQQVQQEQQLSVTEATVSARERVDRVDATLSLQPPS
jgi:general secretion pathway protein M